MKEIISSEKAPKAIGPYSQAVKHGDLIYCSGQIALDHKTQQMVGVTVTEQTKKIMENINEILKTAGSDFTKVLKCTIYLKNMDDFSGMNEFYGSCFPKNPPARATVEVSRLPKDALVEIDCLAHL
jgi:2-iminobutanoate/2-iminopropanoate deaminase